MLTDRKDPMPTDPGKDGPGVTLATIGVVLLPILCCGLPLLIAAGMLGVAGSVLGNAWLIGATGAALLGLVVWRVRVRASGSGDDACCPPERPARDTSHRPYESPDGYQER